MYPLLNQAAHLTSFPEKSKFLCFSMLANTGHDKAYPLSDQIDTPNTAGYKGYKVDSKKSKNTSISEAAQTPNSKLPNTAVHVSAIEPSIKRHHDAPRDSRSQHSPEVLGQQICRQLNQDVHRKCQKEDLPKRATPT